MRKLIVLITLAAFIAGPVYSKEKAPKNEKVKNVILIIGDGMGLAASTVWMINQQYGPTCFDRAQFVGLSKTYSANNRVTDSAAAGTAMATGTKTNNSMLGVAPDGTPVESIASLAKKEGKSVGIVVNSYILDATPGAFYAHANKRGDRKKVMEDLIAFKPEVIIGGGRKYFTSKDYEENGKNMLQKAKEAGFTYVETPEDFYATKETPILGLISEGNYPLVIDRDSDYLMYAAEHTLDILDDNKKGFFAMIEGSQIDHAAHGNNTEELIFEMEEFDKAVNAAFDYADTHKGTLVVVTADHETGGITLPSGNKDYTKGESGLDIKYSSTSHTGSPVIVYAYGASSWKFSGVMENTDIFKKIKEVLID